MKQFLMLCAVSFLVGCGVQTGPDEAQASDELATIESGLTVCGRTSCPPNYSPTAYTCMEGCPNNCTSYFWNAAECIYNSGTFTKCSRGCPSGWYITSYSFSSSCTSTPDSLEVDPNQTTCAPKPAVGEVSSYTKCGLGDCATGYLVGSYLYLSGCRPLNSSSTTANNATVCVAN